MAIEIAHERHVELHDLRLESRERTERRIPRAEIVDGRVRYEWIVTDEVSIWKQIYAHLESRAGG